MNLKAIQSFSFGLIFTVAVITGIPTGAPSYIFCYAINRKIGILFGIIYGLYMVINYTTLVYSAIYYTHLGIYFFFKSELLYFLLCFCISIVSGELIQYKIRQRITKCR